MASNKNNLNFEQLLTISVWSNFKCVFCNKDCKDVYNNGATIEHIFNQEFDRKDITGMMLAHLKCNTQFKDGAKPFNAEKLFKRNCELMNNESFQKDGKLLADRKQAIKILVMFNPEVITQLAPKNVALANNWNYSGSRAVSNAQYAELKEAQLTIENEVLTNKILRYYVKLKGLLAKLETKVLNAELTKMREY